MKDTLYALVVECGDDSLLCFDVVAGSFAVTMAVSQQKAPIVEAHRQITKHWRSQDPARRKKPSPWSVATYRRVR